MPNLLNRYRRQRRRYDGPMTEEGVLKQWRFDPQTQRTGPEAEELAATLGVHAIVAELLLRRGLADTDDARAFLGPKLTDLKDPADVPGAVDAAKRIVRAISDRQPIVIYGDYDVDGITASAILWHMLTQLGADDVNTYVPHRIDEGYGINNEAIEQIIADARPLIVSVDCGITAVEQAKIAKDAGVDLVITDHHEFDPANLPDAFALVHPALRPADPDDVPSPLCGAGVALKLAWQIAREHCGSERLPETIRDLLMDMLSLAALGTVADVVPLVGENRVITSYGLGQIKRTRFAGLNAMIDAASLRDETIDAYHVGFVLGPRLNACGRMGHARDAVHLLTDASDDEAAQVASFLTTENNRRRTTERKIVLEATQMVIDRGADKPDCRAIVLGKEGWHPGVLGIVASRLVDTFAKPVVMLSIEQDEARGSARSVEGVSIHDALAHCDKYLTSYGGHAMAAGVRLAAADIEAFTEQLVDHVNGILTPEDLKPTLNIDIVCSLADLTVDMVRQLQKLAPFGRGNPAPVACVRNVSMAYPPRRVGNNGAHLKLTVTQQGKYADAIAFGMGDLASDLPGGIEMDIAFEPTLNTWQGRTTAQMQVKDVRLL